MGVFQIGNGDCKGNKGLLARYCIKFLLRNTHVSLGQFVEASGGFVSRLYMGILSPLFALRV